MQLFALLVVGFSGLVIGDLDIGTKIPINTAASVPASNPFDAPLVRSPSVEPRAPSSSGIFIPIHKPSHFPFVVIVPDDGKDPSGGWQAAKANLPFEKIDFPITAITWYCPITIQLPIRHSKLGIISPTKAAKMSANVTNSVASRMNFDLPQGVFCETFRAGVRATFPTMYPSVGVRVTL